MTSPAELNKSSFAGLTCFSTGPSTKDLPAQTSEWIYAAGILLKRNLTEGGFLIIGHTGKIATRYIDTGAGVSTDSGWIIN